MIYPPNLSNYAPFRLPSFRAKALVLIGLRPVAWLLSRVSRTFLFPLSSFLSPLRLTCFPTLPSPEFITSTPAKSRSINHPGRIRITNVVPSLISILLSEDFMN